MYDFGRFWTHQKAISQEVNHVKLGSIQSRMSVCFFSSDHRPSEARIKRCTHNDPIMSAVPLTQDKCASKELTATSQQWKGDWRCKKKFFKSVADEIWEKRKFTLRKKNTHPLPRAKPTHSSLHSSVREGGQNVDKFYSGTWPATFSWQMTSDPEAIVNTDRRYSKQID